MVFKFGNKTFLNTINKGRPSSPFISPIALLLFSFVLGLLSCSNDPSIEKDMTTTTGSNSSETSNQNDNNSTPTPTPTPIIPTGPTAFSFSTQENLPLNVNITSSSVTMSGFSNLMLASCNGCYGLVINGYQQNVTSAVINEGDVVALNVTTSTLPNTTKIATFKVGTTVGTFVYKTTLNTPDFFSFTNISNQLTSALITSNTLSLTGTFSNVTATCGVGCVGISRNGGLFSAGPVNGFNTGDTIAIQMISPSTSNTSGTSSVMVGSTLSGTWTVSTTTDACADTTPAIGTLCPDGTVYAGTSYDNGAHKMYVTRCDYGKTWDSDSSSCTGSIIKFRWSDGGTVVTGATSLLSGKSNTLILYSLNGNADGGYHAATACETLVANGHNDWYLPALYEFTEIYTNWNLNKDTFNYAGYLGNFELSPSNTYWTSTENSSSSSSYFRFVDGYWSGAPKSFDLRVRCVRRD